MVLPDGKSEVTAGRMALALSRNCLCGHSVPLGRFFHLLSNKCSDKKYSLFEVVVSDAQRGGENIPRLPRFGAIGTIPAGAPSATLHRRLPLPFERPFHILEFLSRNRRILWSRLDTERLFHQPFAHPRRGSYHSDARSSKG